MFTIISLILQQNMEKFRYINCFTLICFNVQKDLIYPSFGNILKLIKNFHQSNNYKYFKKDQKLLYYLLCAKLFLILLQPFAWLFLLNYKRSMIDQKIKLRLPNAREKLQPLFPQDNRGDIKIIFGKKSFKLQKAFLRLQSTFFKKTFSQANQILQIKQNFNQAYFSNVLKCFYGFTVDINRSDILDYYPIIKYLQVESLLKIIRQDISKNLGKYNVFTILLIAHQFNQQELFENGLSQLEKQNYQQLRYSKQELLKCPIELFKLIIKTHNRLKSQKNKGIPFLEIDQLIKEYSEQKKLSQPEYQQLKFQLIDKKSLNSQEYKEIFLTQTKKKNSTQYKSLIKTSSNSTGLISSTFNNNIFSASKLTQSVTQPIRKINEELTLQIENTYQKKKNEELQAENANLSTQLTTLKNQFSEHSTNFQSFKSLVTRLQQRLDEKDRIDKQQTIVIKRLDKTCQQLKSQVSTRNEVIKKLQDRLSKIEKQPQKRVSGNPKYIPYDEQQEASQVQSHIVPGHMLKQIAKPAADALNPPTNGAFKKAKQQPAPVVQAKIQEELDQDQIEELYLSRLEFDKEPLGCNKRFLPKLANFLTSDGFQKKKLHLIFRRNNTNQETYGLPIDIRNKNSLLFIICTKLNQVIGGFTSITITKNSFDYISDENAFLFSLTKDEKFSIKKSRIKQAIYIASDYLIGFSNDIMIYADCIKTPSECSFPDAYESNGQKRSPKWLTGQDSTFNIKSLQIYEVKEEEMQMDLF